MVLQSPSHHESIGPSGQHTKVALRVMNKVRQSHDGRRSGFGKKQAMVEQALVVMMCMLVDLQ